MPEAISTCRRGCLPTKPTSDLHQPLFFFVNSSDSSSSSSSFPSSSSSSSSPSSCLETLALAMDIPRYAVDAGSIDALATYQIASFFQRHKSVTRDDCNGIATSIIGSPVSPTPVQGVASYTVAADKHQPPKAVQFRDSALNLKLWNEARQTYGELVPNCELCDKLADVFVYQMDLVPGVAFSRIQRQIFSPGMENRLLRTVQDLARFVDLHITVALIYLLIRRLDSLHQRGLIGQSWSCHQIPPANYSPIIPPSSTSFPKACLRTFNQSWMRYSKGSRCFFGLTIQWYLTMTTF